MVAANRRRMFTGRSLVALNMLPTQLTPCQEECGVNVGGCAEGKGMTIGKRVSGSG